MVLCLSFGPMSRASGCGLLPAKGVWRPLAVSQMLCLPHPRVGKSAFLDRSSISGTGALRTAGRCRILGLSCFVPRPPQTSKFPSRPLRKALGGGRSTPSPDRGTQRQTGGHRGPSFPGPEECFGRAADSSAAPADPNARTDLLPHQWST